MTDFMTTRWILLLVFLALSAGPVAGQQATLLGTWQLVRHVSCLEANADSGSADQKLRDEMRSHSAASPMLVTFREKAKAQESFRILNTNRRSNSKKFHYRYNGELLLILDKKSQTITDTYLVEKLSADSLIVSNRNRPCDTRIFIKSSGRR